MEPLDKVIVRVRALPQKVRGFVRRVLHEEGQTAVTGMRSRFVEYPGATGRQLNIRRGVIVNALGERVISRGETTTLQAGVLVEDPRTQMIALTQEKGKAGIRPVVARKLAIPLGLALRSDGTRRFKTVRDARQEYNLQFTAKSIFGRPKGGGTSVRLYARRDEVTLPARPFVGPELDPTAERVTERLADLLQEAV